MKKNSMKKEKKTGKVKRGLLIGFVAFLALILIGMAVNMLGLGKERIKVANMLPAIFLPLLYPHRRLRNR